MPLLSVVRQSWKMSFRDLRNFAEMMRVLGYPRLISLANFRSPNFPLVAEILVWLVKRFDPDTDVSLNINTEEERILLIRSVAEFMVLKTNIKLNTKKLYQADGYAVKELSKLTALLYEAQNSSNERNVRSTASVNNNHVNIVSFDISYRKKELQTTKQLGSQLTVNGATLFDLLEREVQFREMRNNKITRQFDSSEIEIALKEMILSTRKEMEDTRKQIDDVKDTEHTLDTRIERRRTEFDRNQKRLQTLRKVRPAFMEEFEKLEAELRSLYYDYLQKFRYLAYLEHLYEDSAKTEQERYEKRQAATRRQLEQMKAEDVNFESIMEGNDSIFGTNLQENLTVRDIKRQTTEKPEQNTHLKSGTGRSSRLQMSQRRVYGSMSGRQRGTIQESNNSSGSLDSDSDLLIDGDLDDEDDEEEGDEDDDILNSERDKRTVNKIDHSDEDF